MTYRISRWARVASAFAVLAVLAAGPAAAQKKLKWAHVYETSEPYHHVAVWAAEEIAKQTKGKFAIEVFPASALGNEPTINQGLALGTVDIIYTGTSFAGTSYKPVAISNGPGMVRDFNHWKAYRDSALFTELAAGYDKATNHKIVALTYYGERHVTSNKPIKVPADMKGLKLRVPQAPLFLMFAKSVDANATPIAFAEVYLALQQGTVDAQENPLPTIMAKKFYEVQKYINLTGHITENLLTIVGGHVWRGLNADEQKVFATVLKNAAAKATDEIRSQEQKMVAEFEKLGKTVVRSDREAFRRAAAPLLVSGEGGWTKEQYDRFQALK